ncbi:MAG TPA: hypothetical protein PKX48_02760 [Planctomycetota bacterium]|jgi:hypothetical protein|nr:hypothetical protein [Planctomycetota bacterium]OQC20764.1 MAG: hypothetical protein BWX69_01603 [Planctomycetes bacterium ADurb.Bin069]NMD36724.1 hypothetical protein [Planctomycetota bacterium]HNR98374.1 hypothetical protein [Planctomycetota bacterium]HNU26769.1 hypothetical protein [Planctomycetota bacterium]
MSRAFLFAGVVFVLSLPAGEPAGAQDFDMSFWFLDTGAQALDMSFAFLAAGVVFALSLPAREPPGAQDLEAPFRRKP